MLKIFLTNLGKYNEGYLVGEWVELPCYDLDEVLKRIGVSDEPDENGNYYEEYFITDYETDLGIKVDEYESVGKLNEIAEVLEGCDAYVMEALTRHFSDIDEAIQTYTRKEYVDYPRCADMGEVAQQYYAAMGLYDHWEKAGFPVDALEWDTLGRWLHDEGIFIAYDDGEHYGYIELIGQ